MSLGDICETFQDQVDALNPGDGSHAGRLTQMVRKLARDVVEHLGDHHLGEIPAVLQRISELMAALAAEAEDADDRLGRYRRQQALLSLLVLCGAIRAYHAGTHAQRRAMVDALRGQVADALAGLVEAED